MKLCLFFLTLMLLNLNIGHSNSCSFSIDPKNVFIKWKAFKTLKKIGVSGNFNDFKLKGDLKHESIKMLLENTEISIDTLSVDTNNKARDKKIAEFFFSSFKKNATIEGRIQNLKNNSFTLKLSMNDITKEIPMEYTLSSDVILKATGVIDVFDFSLNDQLKSINKACFNLHEGKTWSDVIIELKATFKKTCS